MFVVEELVDVFEEELGAFQVEAKLDGCFDLALFDVGVVH